MHLNQIGASAFAGLAATTGSIKGEAGDRIASLFSFRQFSEEIPDWRKYAGIGGGIRAGRTADRRLIDNYNFINIFRPLYFRDSFKIIFLTGVIFYIR